MPLPIEPALQALTPSSLTADARRLELLSAALLDGRETTGQIRALMQSDCGLCRTYWREVHSSGPLTWLGLSELLTAQPRADFRRWVSAQPRIAVTGDEAARQERQRRNALRRALCGLQVFQPGWIEFDPTPGAEAGVPGVRSAFERYLLLLRDRMYLANLGVLPIGEWFRLPVEALAGLDADGLRAALEQRWARLAALFPALDADENAWMAAHAAAGDLYPALSVITGQLNDILRAAGIMAQASRPLVGAAGPA